MNYEWQPGRFRVKKADTVKIPDYFLNCSAFVVEIANEGDENQYDFASSGFLVALPAERCNGQLFFYFVTTAHSLNLTSRQRYGIRVNLRPNGTHVVPVDRWFCHPSDKNADVLVAPFENKKEYEVQFCGERLFRTKEDLGQYEIGIGDEVYFPGLFTLSQQESDTRNKPILRMGNIAMLPDVKLPTELGPMDAYLVEAHSLGGLSGSPVFSRRTMTLAWNDGVTDPVRTLHGMTGDVHLIGMMHGHWDVKDTDINQVRIQPTSRKTPGVNIGIALVIPMSKVVETLNRADLVHMREEQEELWLNRQRASTAD